MSLAAFNRRGPIIVNYAVAIVIDSIADLLTTAGNYTTLLTAVTGIVVEIIPVRIAIAHGATAVYTLGVSMHESADIATTATIEYIVGKVSFPALFFTCPVIVNYTIAIVVDPIADFFAGNTGIGIFVYIFNIRIGAAVWNIKVTFF